MRLRLPTARLSRDSILFGFGLAGLVYETVSGRAEPTLVVAFVGLAGTPAIVRLDETRRTIAARTATEKAAEADKQADEAYARAVARAQAAAAVVPKEGA